MERFVISRRSLTLSLLALSLPASVLAHAPGPELDVTAVTAELMAFRADMKKAVEARDIEALKAMYTETFTHTHGSGKVDGRDARILSLLMKEPVIEGVEMKEVSVRVHGDAAILAAKSPILNVRENRHYDFRWMQVYVRANGKWQLAASQATRLTLPG